MNWIVYDFSSVCIRLTFVINLGSLIETICVFAQNSLLLCHNIITFFGIKYRLNTISQLSISATDNNDSVTDTIQL